MRQYWARHEGRNRWGVRTPLDAGEEIYQSPGGVFFVWADKVVLDRGNLVFMSEEGEIQGMIAEGRWDAVFEAGGDDSPHAIETRR